MIVLDASAAIELLLRSARGRLVESRLASSEETLHVPHLFTIEVTQVLRRLVGEGRLQVGRAGQALEDLADLDAARYPHDPFLARIWEMRHNLTAYDAAYVALAEVLGAVLLTFDAKLAAGAPRGTRVELLGRR